MPNLKQSRGKIIGIKGGGGRRRKFSRGKESVPWYSAFGKGRRDVVHAAVQVGGDHSSVTRKGEDRVGFN